MHREMRKTRGSKLRRLAACLIDLNEYFAVLSGEKASDSICETDLDKILLNRMTKKWSNQEYVQGFDC